MADEKTRSSGHVRPNPPRFTPFARAEQARQRAFGAGGTTRMPAPPTAAEAAANPPSGGIFQAEEEGSPGSKIYQPGLALTQAKNNGGIPVDANGMPQFDLEALQAMGGTELADPVLGSPFLDANGVPSEVPNSFHQQRNRYLPEQDWRRSPNYRASDVHIQWSRLPLEDRIRAAQYMRQLGFTETADGSWNEGVNKGVTAAMSYGNMNGLSWTGSLQSLARQAAQLEEEANDEARQRILDNYNYLRDNFIDEPYLAPDYDTISMDVRSLFQARLGRRPNDWEIELLADKFTESHRRQWEAAQAADEQMSLANLAVQANADLVGGGMDPSIDVPGVSSGGSLEDPSSTMAAAFEQLYASAIDTEESEESTQQIEGSVLDASDLVRRLTGGI